MRLAFRGGGGLTCVRPSERPGDPFLPRAWSSADSTASSSEPTRGSGSGWQAAARIRRYRLRRRSARRARRRASRGRCTPSSPRRASRLPRSRHASTGPTTSTSSPSTTSRSRHRRRRQRPYRTNTRPGPGCPTRTRSPGSTGRATRRRWEQELAERLSRDDLVKKVARQPQARLFPSTYGWFFTIERSNTPDFSKTPR